MPRTRQAMKQRRSAATDDGMNDDAVLVDEPQLLERHRELGRSDEDTPLGLRFQRRDRLAKVTLHLDRVLPRKVAPRARHDVLRLRLELLCPLAHRARRLFVACHRWPGSLHQLVGVAPEEHRPALIHELRPMVVQLVVHDPLGVIDAPVQSHVETEGEEAHGVGFYQKRSQRAAARAKGPENRRPEGTDGRSATLNEENHEIPAWRNNEFTDSLSRCPSWGPEVARGRHYQSQRHWPPS